MKIKQLNKITIPEELVKAEKYVESQTTAQNKMIFTTTGGKS